MKQGYVQIYFGYGKGKSTAASGIILRAVTFGFKIAVFRFFKPKGVSSENKVLEKFRENIKIYYPKYSAPQFAKGVSIDRIIQDQRALFDTAKEIINKYDIVILDEGLDIIKYKIISTEEMINFIKEKPKGTELILTGHYINRRLKKYADLITEFKKVKHYYDRGIKARKGIEF